MPIPSVFFRLIYPMVLCSVLLSASWAHSEAKGSNQQSEATLYVRGEAELLVAPDQVSINLGVTTEAKTAKKAVQLNSKKMQAVFTSLISLGLTEREYQTQQFRVQPIWSSRPKQADRQWRAEIIAYKVHNGLRVTTQSIDIISDIIGAATAAGANDINSVNFSLSNPRLYREKAIATAMQNAKADAITLVAASGDSIERTLSIQLDNAIASRQQVPLARAKSYSALESIASDHVAPPIDAGDIRVKASVSVTYQLASPD